MIKYFFILIIFVFSCSPTEHLETHDDNAILQILLNIADPSLLQTLINEFDIDGNGFVDCVELPNTMEDSVVCTLENGRFTTLKLNNIALSGNIPDNIGDLTELTQLSLKNNNLNGWIPESIGNLTKLTQLSLAKNYLDGTIPDTIGNLESLWWLDLSNNLLSGTLPVNLGQLAQLEVFLADSNNLSGAIPNDICNIYDQEDSNFELSGNQFCNDFPSCLDTRQKLGYQNCDTSCDAEYEFQDGYCYFQTDLNVLQTIIENSLATDSLNMNMDANSNGDIEPLELGTQKWSAGRLETLDCFWDTTTCNLNIPIPENIDDLDGLKILDLQQNNLFGEIPENICTMFSIMDSLNLSENKYCPCYPKCSIESDQYDNFINTQDTTDCSSCNEGYTPELICNNLPKSVAIIEGDSLCFKIDNLDVLQTFINSSTYTPPDSLDMSMDANSNGIIQPLELGNQKWVNGKLLSLNASNRGLSGGIPENIDKLDSLIYLNISDNDLSGELPDGIYNLMTIHNLQSLDISGNQLSGELVPVAICLKLDNWDIDGDSTKSYLDNNNFCPGPGGYPSCIENYIGEQNTDACNPP